MHDRRHGGAQASPTRGSWVKGSRRQHTISSLRRVELVASRLAMRESDLADSSATRFFSSCKSRSASIRDCGVGWLPVTRPASLPSISSTGTPLKLLARESPKELPAPVIARAKLEAFTDAWDDSGPMVAAFVKVEGAVAGPRAGSAVRESSGNSRSSPLHDSGDMGVVPVCSPAAADACTYVARLSPSDASESNPNSCFNLCNTRNHTSLPHGTRASTSRVRWHTYIIFRLQAWPSHLRRRCNR